MRRRSRASVDALIEGVLVIGDVLGDQAACVDAAAMLTLIGTRLGYELVPTPVSVVAHRRSSPPAWAFMGPRAAQLVPDGVQFDEHPANADLANGHLVMIASDPQLLLDPNIRQINGHGFDVSSVVLPIASLQPESGTWSVRHGDTDIMWIPDGNQALMATYAAAVADKRNAESADRLVSLLRRGLTAKQIAVLHK